MKKAYNVYKIYGKTHIPKFLKDLSFMFLLGVCFLGFQTQGTAQAVFTSGPNGATPGKIVEDIGFIKGESYSITSENAIAILRNHLETVQKVNHLRGNDLAEVEQQHTILFTETAALNLASNQDVTEALANAYSTLVNSSLAVSNSSQVSTRAVADAVASLLR